MNWGKVMAEGVAFRFYFNVFHFFKYIDKH